MPRPYPASLRERVLADLALGDLEGFPKRSYKNPDSVAAVARRYGISEGTVRRWQRAERDEALKHYRNVRRSVPFSESDRRTRMR